MKFCTACGTRAEDASDRWCGSCGAPYPETTQTRQTTTGVDPSAASTPPAAFGGTTESHPEVVAALAEEPKTAGRRKTPFIVGGALVGVLGLVGVGVAVTQLGGSSGGAETPEAAVQGVLDSLTSQDPVSAVRVINPDEATGLDNAVNLTVERIKKAGFDTNGRFTDAIDVRFSETEFDVEPMGDNAAKVIIDAEVKASFDPEKLPEHMRDDPSFEATSVTDDLGTLLKDSPWRTRDTDRAEVFLVTVKQEGRWYVSPSATALEVFAEDAGVPGGDFDEATLKPTDPTAATPDDAVSGLLRSLENDDLDEAAGLLVRGQGDLVRAYQDSFRQVLSDRGLSWSVGGTIRTHSDVSGDGALVTVEQAELSGTIENEDDYDSGTLGVDGDCLEVEEDRECIGEVMEETTGLKEFQFLTVKEGGQWRVDLYGTVMRYVEGAARTLPQDAVAEALDAPFLAERLKLSTGEDHEVELSTIAGNPLDKVLEFQGVAGKVLRIQSDGEARFAHVKGGLAEYAQASTLVVPVETDGPVRVLVQSYEDDSFTVRADVLDVSPVTEGGTLEPGAVYSFTPTEGSSYDMPDGLSICRIREDGSCDDYTEFGFEGSSDKYLMVNPDGGTAPPESDDSYDDYYE